VLKLEYALHLWQLRAIYSILLLSP